MLLELTPHGWPSFQDEVQKDLQPYWTFRDEIAIIDSIAVKGRRIIIPVVLQDKAQQLHLNHMDIEKTRLLACESICWINMNADIEVTVKIFQIALISMLHDQKKKRHTDYQGDHGNQ